MTLAGVAVLGATADADALRSALGSRLAPSADAGLLVDARHAFAEPPVDPRAALRLVRAPWAAVPGDDWREVDTPEQAFAALDPAWRRVLLTLGRDRLAPFRADASRFYAVRARGDADAPTPTPLGVVLTEPGPFDAEGEARLMRALAIDALVTRNAGGAGAYPKVAAARALGLPVVMQRRPAYAGPLVVTAAAALDWLERRA